jgi:hypothetical protein
VLFNARMQMLEIQQESQVKLRMESWPMIEMGHNCDTPSYIYIYSRAQLSNRAQARCILRLPWACQDQQGKADSHGRIQSCQRPCKASATHPQNTLAHTFDSMSPPPPRTLPVDPSRREVTLKATNSTQVIGEYSASWIASTQ